VQVTALPPIDLMALLEQGTPERPSGLHVSQIIRSLLQTVDRKRYDPAREKPWDKIASGVDFERGLERLFKRQFPGVFRPEPILCEGIWCSPDGIDPKEWAVVEIKLTWYSSFKECPYHEVYWPWRVQIMAYCYAVKSLVAVLFPQFVNGNYRPPTPAPLVPYRLRFTDQEVLENWWMLRNHAIEKGWL
jgi:hypothetical protein